MRLTPREVDRLLLFQAAELARRRRGRGLLLGQAEATALIADEVMRGRARRARLRRRRRARLRGARPGRRARRRRRAGSAHRGRGAVRRRHAPDRAARPDRPRASLRRRSRPSRRSCGSRAALGPFAARNAGDVPIGAHLALPPVRGQPAPASSTAAPSGACGSALAAGVKIVVEPGESTRAVRRADRRRSHRARPRRPRRRPARRARRAASAALGAGARAGLPRCLSLPRPAGRQRPRGRGRARRRRARRDHPPAGATRCATGSACAPSAAASRSRSSAACCSTRCSACAARRSASPAAASSRSAAPGNPDTMDGDRRRARHRHRRVRRARPDRDARRHRQPRAPALAAGLRRRAGRRPDDARHPGLRPGLEPRHATRAEGMAAMWAAFDAHPAQRRAAGARLLVPPRPGRATALRAGGAGLKIHEDVGAGPEQIRCALDVADRHDVQLAIHTDGLNEALSVEDTLAAFARPHRARLPHRGRRRRALRRTRSRWPAASAC